MYINDVPGMALTYFTARSTWVASARMMKSGKLSFNCRKHAGNEQMDRIFMFMKNFWPQAVVCPCPGAKCMYIIVILKHLLL